MIEAAGRAHPGAVIVNGDDLRTFHPDYPRFMTTDPLSIFHDSREHPEGLAQAQARGRTGGRPTVMTPERLDAAKQMRSQGASFGRIAVAQTTVGVQ